MNAASRSSPRRRKAAPRESAAAESAVGRFARIVDAFAADSRVAVGAGRKRGFGAGALAVRGRIFALLSSRGCFVVKLPAARVAALEAAGLGRPFKAGRGRPMREWLEVGPGYADEWPALAHEALAFVGALR